MDSENTKKTSPPLQSMPSEKDSISDKESQNISPTKINQVRFQNDIDNDFFMSQDQQLQKNSRTGTSKNLIKPLALQKKPFGETVKSPSSVWNSDRRIDQLIENGEMSREISSSMKDTHFHKTNNFGDFHDGSIHTQRIPDQESKRIGNPESLVVSQNDSQMKSPNLHKSKFKGDCDMKQQVSLKSHISTPKKDSVRVPQAHIQTQVSSQLVTQRSPLDGTVNHSPIASAQHSGQFIKIQTNDTNKGSQINFEKSERAQKSIKESVRNQVQDFSSVTEAVVDEIADDDNSSVSIILPYSNLLPKPKQSQLQIAKKNLNEQIKFQNQIQSLQSKSFLAQPNFGISGSQPGVNKYQKRMRAKYRKKAQQTYFTQLSQLLANQNISSKNISTDRQSKDVLFIPTERSGNKVHDLSNIDEISTKQISSVDHKNSTIKLQTHQSPKRDTSTSPCLPDTQRKDMKINNDYQERIKQYQQSLNEGPIQQAVDHDDANRFIIGRKSIQTDRPVQTAQVAAVENASPKPKQISVAPNLDLKQEMEVHVASNTAERHGGDDGLYDSDYYNNNLQAVNHPLMEEYERKIQDYKHDYHQMRENFVKRMMKQNKAQIVLPKNHHNKTMAQDLDKLNNAINFVTEIQIQNSLQEIYNREERNEIASDNTHLSNVSNQQQIVIKTKNKSDRTTALQSSKVNSKDFAQMMDEHKFANISDAENENQESEKYQKSSQVTQSPLTTAIPGKNQGLNNIYQSRKEPPLRSDSEGGQTLYHEVSQNEGTPNQMKITGKFLSNQKLSKFANQINNQVSRDSTLKNLIPAVHQNQNYKQGDQTNKTQQERQQKMNKDDLYNKTSTPNLQANFSSTPPPQPSVLNAKYDNNRNTDLSQEIKEESHKKHGLQERKPPKIKNSMKDNLQFMIGQSSSTTNEFPKINNNRYKSRDSEEKSRTNERSQLSPQTLLSKQPSYNQDFEKKQQIPQNRKLSINNPKQININSKIHRKINDNPTNLFILDNQKESIQRFNDENSSLNGSYTHNFNEPNGLRISLPALGNEILNYSQMLDTSKNSNSSFQGTKKFQMQNARNSSMIQISKTNLDVAQMLLSTSKKAALSQSRRHGFDQSTSDLENASGIKRTMKQELVRLKEIQRLKELKDLQIKSQSNMQKLLYRELMKAHNPAMNFKNSQRPGKFKTKKMFTEMEGNKSALLLDVIKQKSQKQQIKSFKGRDLSKLDTNRQFFGSLKEIESSRTSKSPNKNNISSVEQLEQQSAVLKSIRKSIQFTDITSEDQKRNEQEMQYIINNITERDVLRIQNNNAESPAQVLEKSNKKNLSKIQMIMLSSKSDINNDMSSTDQQFISFSKKNSKLSKKSDIDSNQKFMSGQKYSAKQAMYAISQESLTGSKARKRQSMDQRIIFQNDGDRIETNNSKVRVRENGESPQLLVTRNETQLLMNQSSKTSQPGEVNSRGISMRGANEEIENNFSTNTSKERLILKSQIRSDRSNENDTQIRSKENEIKLESSTIINRSSQPVSKEVSVEISSPKNYNNLDEISNLKNIAQKKTGFKTDLETTQNNSIHQIKEIDHIEQRHSSGSQTEVQKNTSIVQIFESQSPQMMSGIAGLHSQDTVECKKEQSPTHGEESLDQPQQRQDQNESPGFQTHKSVISGVKIYRKSSQKFKKSGQHSQFSPSDKELTSSFQRSQIMNPMIHRQDLHQKINATQISLSPISLRSPSHSNLKKGIYQHEGPSQEKIGVFTKPTLNQIIPQQQQQLTQEFMLPKHLSQLSFAVQQNPRPLQVANKDISPNKQIANQAGKTTALNIIQESQLGDTFKITPRMDENILSIQQHPSPAKRNNKSRDRNQKVRFSVKSYDAGAHPSLTQEVNFSHVFDNLICQPLNIKKLNELKRINKSQNRQLMKIWKKNVGGQLGLNLSNLKDQDPGKDQHIQTSNRGLNQNSVQSFENDPASFEQQYQRGWDEEGQVMQIIPKPEMSKIKSQVVTHKGEKNPHSNLKLLSSTTTFKANQQYAITPIEEFNSTDKNGTLEIRSPNENSKTNVAPFAVMLDPTSVSSMSNDYKSNQQHNPIDIVQVNSHLLAFSNLHVDTSMSQSPKYSPKDAAFRKKIKDQVKPGQIQAQEKAISNQNIAQDSIHLESQMKNQESQSRMATEQQYDEIIRKAEESNKWMFPPEMLSQGGERHLMLGAYKASSSKLAKASPRAEKFNDNGTQMQIIDQNYNQPNDFELDYHQEHGVLYQDIGKGNQMTTVINNRKLFSYQQITEISNSTKKGDLFAISHTHVA